jgi:hypothetical protein
MFSVTWIVIYSGRSVRMAVVNAKNEAASSDAAAFGKLNPRAPMARLAKGDVCGLRSNKLRGR